MSDLNYEDKHIYAVSVGSMHSALSVINTIGCAHLLRQIVSVDEGFWLIFKKDSWLKQQINDLAPGLDVRS